jgi:hypothetical protein
VAYSDTDASDNGREPTTSREIEPQQLTLL